MPTRQTASLYQKSLFSVPPLPTGYSATPSDLFISPVGIEDVDKALFNLFDKEIGFQVSGDDVDGAKKLSVVFQAGEKWALLKKLRSMRDRNGSLKLPIMSVLRTSVVQDLATDVNGRGINQQTGELVVKRRLDKSDRTYQNSINRLGIQHQSNVVSTDVNALPMTSKNISDLLLSDPDVVAGALLKSNKTNNIFEIIVLPSPQFFTATYEVTFWAQYTTHMNQLLGQLMGSFLPQGNAWRIDTPTGYWFIAVVDNNSYSSKENADDFSNEERVIKYEFIVTIKGYSFAPREPGQPIPVRRYVSAPQVSFEVSTNEASTPSGIIDPFLGADDPTLPMNKNVNKRVDQRFDGNTLLYKNPGFAEEDASPQDPALLTIPRGVPVARYKKVTTINGKGQPITRYVKVHSVNKFTGESVIAIGDASLGSVSLLLDE